MVVLEKVFSQITQFLTVKQDMVNCFVWVAAAATNWRYLRIYSVQMSIQFSVSSPELEYCTLVFP